MPYLDYLTDDEPTYDYATYALECQYNIDRPGIDTKFIKSISSDTLERLDRIPKRFLIPPEGNQQTGVDKYEVVNEDQTESYPLYQEIAAEANTVYYVGSTTKKLRDRIKQHLQSSRKTVFLEDVDKVHLEEVRWYHVNVDTTALIEALDAELHTEICASPDHGDKIQAEYEEESVRIQNLENITNRTLTNKKIESSEKLPSALSYAALNGYSNQVEKSRTDHERGLAIDKTDFKEGPNGTVHPSDIRAYAYWN